MDRRAHREGVYATRGPEQVSRFQAEARLGPSAVLVATFAEDGPLKCRGREVARYSADALHAQIGAVQRFMYCLGRHRPHGDARRVA
jgi:hypothetical protein